MTEKKVPVMENLTLLDNGSYFGFISSKDKLVIVDIAEHDISE